MYSKLALFVAASMAAFVSALPRPGGTPSNTINNSCNAGKLQCCNSVQSAKSAAVQKQAGLLGVLAAIPADLDIGLDCTPISVLSIAGNSCNQQPTCCTGNNIQGGLLAIGCSPINLNL